MPSITCSSLNRAAEYIISGAVLKRIEEVAFQSYLFHFDGITPDIRKRAKDMKYGRVAPDFNEFGKIRSLLQNSVDALQKAHKQLRAHIAVGADKSKWQHSTDRRSEK